MTKHHYRKVMKSEHLGCADLEDLIEEGKPLIFTIKHVRQEIGAVVAGKKGNFNIAYFNEPIKPLVLNATNAKRIRTFAGGSPFVEDWNNIKVELFIDENVKMKGETVGGVRILAIQPKTQEKPKFLEIHFEKALLANASLDKIKEKYDIDLEVEKKYNDLISKNNGTEN